MNKRWLCCAVALVLWTGAGMAQDKELARAVFTNSDGVKTERFAPMDSVFGSFCKLQPGVRYDIRILDGKGREMSACAMTADRRGIIPTTALWWDMGARYSLRKRFGALERMQKQPVAYLCRLEVKGRVVAKYPIILDPTKPHLFTCDRNGRPSNGFAKGKGDMFIQGRNFEPGMTLYLYLVPDRYAWRPGDRLEPVTERPLTVKVQKNGEFQQLLWPAKEMRIGSFDIVVKHIAGTVLDKSDLIRSIYSVGVTIFQQDDPAPLEVDLACQAPPQDPLTGTVIGAPNPFYKDTFSPQEEVWAAINPTAGGVDMSGTNARLYVVNHLDVAHWTDGLPLVDVSSDGYELVTIQPGCANHNYHRIWPNPVVRDDGYDVVVDYPPFGVYNAGTDLVDKLDARGFVVPSQWISMASLAFNHDTTSASNDALNIRRNYTEEITVPEWQPGKPTSPAAYIVHQSVSVKAVFHAAPGVISARIRAAVDYGPLGAIASQVVSFAGGTSGPVLFPLIGLTPDCIRYDWQKWRWYISDINGSGSPEIPIAANKNLIYTVLSQPQGPWTTSGQTKPWTDVLDKSCMWAYGESTPAGAASKIAHHLYNDVGGLYVYGSQYTSGGGQPFQMTNFLANIPSVGLVNCYDMGKSLVSFSDVVGCNLVYRYTSPWGALNCSKAVGRAWKCDEAFGNHGFGTILPETMFDACLVIDGDASPNVAPSTEFWLLDIFWNAYKTKVMENPGGVGTPTVYSFTVQ